MKLATVRQLNLISKLVEERDDQAVWDNLDGLVWERMWDSLGGKPISTQEASDVIQGLLAISPKN